MGSAWMANPCFWIAAQDPAKLRLRTTRLRLYETPNLGVSQTGSSATIATGSLAKGGISSTFPVDCDIEIASPGNSKSAK
jgi:hypothetical protein